MAREFSGSGQYITRVNPTGMLADDAWTFGAWAWFDTYGTDGRGIMRLGDQGTAYTRGMALNVRSSGVLDVRVGGQSSLGVTAAGTGAWVRIGCTRVAAGVSHSHVILNGSSDSDDNLDGPSEIQTGDEFRLSASNSDIGVVEFDGRLAWPFWLQGVTLSATALDDYLNQTNGKTICSLITDYGPSGGITANALKFLGPIDTDFLDISGVGNDLTNTGTTSVAEPSGLPSSCSTGPIIPVFMNQYRQRRG